jgi:hypothetical protein
LAKAAARVYQAAQAARGLPDAALCGAAPRPASPGSQLGFPHILVRTAEGSYGDG